MKASFTSLTSRKKIVVILALLTGLLHLLYGVLGLFPIPGTFDYIFISNFIGNVFFISILYFTDRFEEYHQIIRYLFVLFTLTSILAYFIVYAPAGLNQLLLPAGVFDKLLEVALIVFILMDRPLEEQSRQTPKNTTTA